MEFAADERLHRLIKEALDSGRAKSLAEAEDMFRGYKLEICIGPEEAKNPLRQATLLTAVAVARRVFLGGVSVAGPLNVELQTLRPFGQTLDKAVRAVGGRRKPATPGTPRIIIEGEPRTSEEGFSIRTATAGWRGGVLPAESELVPAAGPDMPLAAMLSAGLAVNEAFMHVSGAGAIAGRRPCGFSLWNPAQSTDWLAGDPSEPRLHFLPAKLWLLGLGHLGQAYLWALALLPFDLQRNLSLTLQDVDVVTPSTESTSILTDSSMVGTLKTRAMAQVAERFGFETRIVERLFDGRFNRHADEPAVALCGLDNSLGRQALDRVGFALVVEAGLGRGHRDFRAMRVHVLPGTRSASEIWKRSEEGYADISLPAYQRILEDGELDRCGVTRLAGRAVGAPFVGVVAASLVVSELLRLLHGGAVHSVIDLDLQGIEHRSVALHSRDFSSVNPGFVSCRGS